MKFLGINSKFSARRWISPILLIVLWEIIGRMKWVDPFFLPPPTSILRTWFRLALSGELMRHMEISLYRALGGYFLAVVLGLGFGIVICWSKKAEDILDPVFELIRPISPLGLTPLMIIWFGIGNGSKVAIVFKACFFPILLNTVSGIKGVNIKLIQAARSLGAGKFQLWSKVILPAALPVIFTGMRISTAISMMAIVVVEMLAADSGLGFMIIDAQHVWDTERMFVGILTLSILGFCMDLIARAMQKRFVGWHLDAPAAGKI
jgi:ABC-type nitrate/sulfonate/bicarbonate transport system permease component